MKIRNCFVGNSSTSVSIIVVKKITIDDLNKWILQKIANEDELSATGKKQLISCLINFYNNISRKMVIYYGGDPMESDEKYPKDDIASEIYIDLRNEIVDNSKFVKKIESLEMPSGDSPDVLINPNGKPRPKTQQH